jgi:hypothetical protein
MGEPPRLDPASYLLETAKELARDLVAVLLSVVRHWLALFGGAVVTVALFTTEHQRGEAYSWPAAERIIGSALLIALFLSWRENYRGWRDERKALAAERESKLPKLFAYIRFIGKGGAKGTDLTLYTAQIEIRNDGFRSVVKDFCPTVVLNGQEFLGQLAKTGETVAITVPNGEKVVFRESDAIYNVTKKPIEPGDVRAGHLHFFFGKAAGDFDKHLIRIQFRDYRNRAFVTEPIDAKSTVSARTLPNLGGMFSLKQHGGSAADPVDEDEVEDGQS